MLTRMLRDRCKSGSYATRHTGTQGGVTGDYGGRYTCSSRDGAESESGRCVAGHHQGIASGLTDSVSQRTRFRQHWPQEKQNQCFHSVETMKKFFKVLERNLDTAYARFDEKTAHSFIRRRSDQNSTTLISADFYKEHTKRRKWKTWNQNG